MKCKVCGKEFHWCATCDPGLDIGSRAKDQGYCSKLCLVMSWIEEDEEDLLLAYLVVKDLMNENLELQARLSVYEEI